MSRHNSFFAATVHIKGSDVCTLDYISSERYEYSDVTKYLKEEKLFHVNGVYTTCMCICSLLSSTNILAVNAIDSCLRRAHADVCVNPTEHQTG